MMNGEYLLDTNIVIALFANDADVIKQIDQAVKVFLPAIVIGELYYGAFNSKKQQVNLERVDQLRTQVAILACDDTTAKFYGQIKKQLKINGTPIPENDIWIAAIASQYGLSVVTRDKHFSHIESLNIVRW